MKNKKLIIVTFGELSTKGKNIMDFIRLLGKNVKRVLSKYECEILVQRDHIYIYYDNKNHELIYNDLKNIPGIASFYEAIPCKNDINDISKKALSLFRKSKLKTFKVQTKRVNKNFSMNSEEVNRHVGSYILQNKNSAKVDVHNPSIMIHIMIRDNQTYVYGLKEKGLGGYPCGIAGKGLHLISGGIDSPVGAFLMMKRGVTLEMIHFEAPPYTSNKVIDKIKDLLHILNFYQPSIKLHIVPFTKLEKEIYDKCGPSYAVTLMRRMMLRIASIIASRNKCLVISSGESIGQVASQTLHSINVIDEVSSYPVIRPLACYDKVDIINLAKQIKTYDISIRPYEDCCTIFEIKDPVTHPSFTTVYKMEENIDVENLIQECIDNTKYIVIKNTQEEI